MDFPMQYIFTATTGTEAGTNWTDDSNAWDGDIDTYAYRTVSSTSEDTKWIQGSTLEYSSGGDPYDWPDEFDSIEIGIFLPTTISSAFGFAYYYIAQVIDGTVGSWNAVIDLGGNVAVGGGLYTTTISTAETMDKSFIENNLKIRCYAKTLYGTFEIRIAKFVALANVGVDNPLTCYYTSNSQTSTADTDWTSLSNSTNGSESSSTNVALVNSGDESEVLSYTANNNTETTGQIIKVYVGIVMTQDSSSGVGECSVHMIPRIGGSSDGKEYETQVLGGTQLDNVVWFNITSEIEPSWDWDDIDDLDIKIWAINESAAGTDDVDLYGVYLKVFYKTPGTHGLRVWDSSSNIILDLDSRISRLLYTTEVAADADGSYTLTNGAYGLLDNDEFVGFAFALEPNKAAHSVDVNLIKGTNDILIEWTAIESVYAPTSAWGISSSKSLIIAMAW